MSKIAFFDLDKTILSKDSIIPFLKFYIKKRPKVIFNYLLSIPYLVLFLLKIIDNNKIKEFISKIFKGETVKSISDIGEEFAASVIPSFYYKDALKEIDKLKNEGYELILITASFYFYAKAIAKNLGFDKCIATELWHFKDKYTGFIYGQNCYGKEKRFRLLTEGYGEKEIDGKIAYSDSISDIPLFNFAETKICINPNKKFEKYVIKNKSDGFFIVNWR